MKKQFIGKYAAGARKAAAQEKAGRDFEKSLPLHIRKAIKAVKAANAHMCAALPASNLTPDEFAVARDEYNRRRAAVDALKAETDRLIKEYRNAATN